MQPSFFSKKSHLKTGKGWYQSGANIEYTESIYKKDINEVNRPNPNRHWQQLSFTFSFDHPTDEVTCAYTVPYTYTELQHHMTAILQLQKDFVHVESIG